MSKRSTPRCKYDIAIVSTPTASMPGSVGSRISGSWRKSGNKSTSGSRKRKTASGSGRIGSRTPRTPQIGTPSIAQPNNLYIVAVTEYRNQSHIGLAAFNLMQPEFLMYQFADNQTYSNLLMLLNNFDPEEILIPDTIMDRALGMVIQDEFESKEIFPARRKFFNENEGVEYARMLGIDGTLEGIGDLSQKYLALACLGCLVRYIQHVQNMTFPRNCLRITFRSLDGRMKIDSLTVRKLELVRCNLPKKFLRARKLKKTSLFEVLNYCSTPMGARLLRSSILQPFNDMATIQARLDTIEKLITADDNFFVLLRALEGFCDLDHLNSCIITIPKVETIRSSTDQIANVLHLKKTLETFPLVAAACKSCESDIMKLIGANLEGKDPEFLAKEISKYLHDDAKIAKGNLAESQKQIALAVEEGMDGLLDAARKAYLETTEKISEAVSEYRELFNTSGIKLQFNQARGYYLSMPAETLEFPSGQVRLVQVVRRGKRILASTEQLISLNDKAKDCFEEIITRTSRVINELISSLRSRIGWMYNAAESIAFLDMMMSLTQFVLKSEGYVRPDFTKDGAIAIRDGRHCVLEHEIANGPFIANNAFITSTQSLNIVTGPNNAGKSTYLLQVALMTILAHLGCYVPASYASFRLTDQVFTLMLLEDDIESNTSTFVAELRQLSYILRNANEKSLIIIDELGRGTSTLEGIAICWSTCEELLRRKAYTLFATHFLKLTRLNVLYPGITLSHCQVAKTSKKVEFKYKMDAGPKDISEGKYGIYVAQLAGFPASIIKGALKIHSALQKSSNEKISAEDETERRHKLLEALEAIKHTYLIILLDNTLA
ncbi:hypothetical protein AAMO2058_001230500 [Amorphochlora amoebiformis]